MTERTIPVELIHDHPHAGKEGVCYPERPKADGDMFFVRLEDGTEVYVSERQMRRAEVGGLWIGVDEHDRRLAEAMEFAGLPKATVNKARQGLWSDFKSPLPLPKMELVAVCERYGATELAKRVKEGEFDD